jgi:hypothetical protein
MVSYMMNILKELSFYQKNPLFFDAIFEAHLPYFEQKKISFFEIVLYNEPNVHIETWRISQAKAELVMKESYEIKRISHLGNRLTIPFSTNELRTVYVDHSPAPRMGYGRKETWSLCEGKWTCLESKGTWIG